VQLALFSLFAVIAVLLVVRAARRDKVDYRRFKKLKSTRKRQKTFAKWLREAFFLFGALSLVVLLAAWQFVPLASEDALEWSPLAWLSTHLDRGFGQGIVIGVSIAFVLALILPVFLFRNRVDEVTAVGDIAALLPRTRKELIYGAALSLNAGILEELLFRLGMPALLFGITGNGILSFALAALLFGLLHIYQGVWGVVGATLLGLLFTLIYLLSGSILIVMAVHVLIDVRSLVLIPLVVRKVWRVSA
jgi:membrane protease YdiL (CAAX protease family)